MQDGEKAEKDQKEKEPTVVRLYKDAARLSRDPISKMTRSRQNYLLALSVFNVLVAASVISVDLDKLKFPILGTPLSVVDLRSLMICTCAATAFYLVLFLLSAFQDIVVDRYGFNIVVFREMLTQAELTSLFYQRFAERRRQHERNQRRRDELDGDIEKIYADEKAARQTILDKQSELHLETIMTLNPNEQEKAKIASAENEIQELNKRLQAIEAEFHQTRAAKTKERDAIPQLPDWEEYVKYVGAPADEVLSRSQLIDRISRLRTMRTWIEVIVPALFAIASTAFALWHLPITQHLSS